MAGDEQKPGATGKFPDGKLKDDDKGEIKMSIGNYKGNVVVDFGEKVKWFALPPEEARRLGELIIEHADKAVAEASG